MGILNEQEFYRKDIRHLDVENSLIQVVLSGMSKTKIIPELAAERMSQKVILELFENIGQNTNPPDWMKKISNVDLLGRINELAKAPNAKDHFSKIQNINQAMDVFRVVKETYEHFIFVNGRKPESFTELDKFNSKPKYSKTKKKYNELDFQIDEWKELLIELDDADENWVVFRKVYNSKPSYEQIFKMRYKELGWGEESRKFLEIASTSNQTGSFIYSNRMLKSRVDRSLRNLFGLEEMAIIAVKKKKYRYYPLFKIYRQDKDGYPYAGHVHSNEHKRLPPDNI